MALYIEYEAAVGGAFEDVTARFRKLSLDVTTNAEEGSVAMSNMLFDDPLGNYQFVGWRRVHVYETEEDSATDLIYSGWVGPRGIKRGQYHRTAAARVWNLTLADFNSMLEMRLFDGSDANRPAETDVERIQWLFGTNEMNRILDDTYINTGSPKNMDASDCRGLRIRDVIDSCAQASGKNYFVISAHDAADRGLWYDFAGSTAYSSTLKASNVMADVDNDLTFYMSVDAELTRDPSRVYSGAQIEYDGGRYYEEDFTTSGIFTRRDASYSAPHVKTGTKAAALAQRYLADTNYEEDRITFGMYLPRHRIGHIKQGQRMQIKASHLPGYESFGYARVLQKKILEVSEGSDQAYLVTLELSSTPVPSACTLVGGTLTIHIVANPDFPDRLWTLYTGPAFTNMDIVADSIPAGDYVYAVGPQECCIWILGSEFGDTSGGVGFNGITWSPEGGGSTYYAENGDGSGGHFFQYDNSIPNSFTADASTWSFPFYAIDFDGTIIDYGPGLNNGVAFVLP